MPGTVMAGFSVAAGGRQEGASGALRETWGYRFVEVVINRDHLW